MSEARAVSVWDLLGDERNAEPFRLAIVGFATLERQIDRAIAEAFGGEIPNDVLRAPFRARLALARVLNLVPDELLDALGRLAKLRHGLAHHTIDDVDEPWGRQLLAVMIGLVPEHEAKLRSIHADAEPGIILVNLLVFVQEYLTITIDEARERRVQLDEAMDEWTKARRPDIEPLTPEQIKRILDESEPGG